MREPLLRAPTLDDVVVVVAVVNEEALRWTGSNEVDADVVRGWWTQPAPFDLSEDVVVALRGTDVVGYGDLSDHATGGGVFWLDVRGAEEDAILGELERRARDRARPGAVIRTYAHAEDGEHRSRLESRGYVHVRSSFRMERDLATGVPDPVWPAGCRARRARRDVDEELLHALNEASFADHWGYTPTPYDEWLHWLLELGEPDPSLWFVAEADGRPAGIALCRRAAAEPDCGWVSTLGVLREFRGRGIGSALLHHAFGAFRDRGLVRAGLGVDAENTTGAVRLYERAGMRIVHRHDLWERPV